jgi:uncharacterized membrane protein YedE/YeeE
MENFTPLSAAIGGVLIGLATTVLWVANGRAAGISSIAGGIYPVHRGDTLWRIVFIVGLAAGAVIGFQFGPKLLSEVPATLPAVSLSPVLAIVAGLLVGIGTRVGRGCTSGHGICGLARFSMRSVVAVGTFMATAAITVFIVRHVVS